MGISQKESYMRRHFQKRCVRCAIEGDALVVDIPPRSMVAAVHACNELNPRIIERARAVDAAWAVLPCCVRAGTYLPCRIGGTLKDDDEAKHMINCGVVAGQYNADRLQAIDRRITNRNVLICGGANFANYAEATRRCSEGNSAQVVQGYPAVSTHT